MSLRQSLKYLVPALMVFVSLGASPAQAALPLDLGDFQIDFTSNAPSDETDPKQTCLINSVLTSDQDAISMAMYTLEGDNQISCTIKTANTSTNATDQATVTNEVLGLAGTAIVVCDSIQAMNMEYLFGYKDVDSVRTMFMRYTNLSMNGMRNCTWIMKFNDAKKSTLVGGLAGPMTSSATFDEVNNLFNVGVNVAGSMAVTGGTGKFAGVTGSAKFDHSATLSLPAEVSLGGSPLAAQNNPQPLADEDEPPLMITDMVLTTSKGGGLKIVSPPLSTSTKRTFGVVTGKVQKIRLVTSPGAQCNVFAKMGTKMIKLTPKPLVAKNGVLSTSITAAIVAGKFGYKKYASYKNKKGQITAVCNAGLKKKNISSSVAFTFTNG